MMEQVPLPEITSRAPALQKALAGQNLDLALIHQAADLFYYTGTLVDGFLALAPQGSPLLLVRRPQHRIAAAPPAWPQVFYNNLKEIPALLGKPGSGPRGRWAWSWTSCPPGFTKGSRSSSFRSTPSGTSRR